MEEVDARNWPQVDCGLCSISLVKDTLQECATKSRVAEFFDAEDCIGGDGDKHSGKTEETTGQVHTRKDSQCSDWRKPLRTASRNKREMALLGTLPNLRDGWV